MSHHMGQRAPVSPGESRHQLPQTRHLVSEGELGRLDEVLVEVERQQGLGQGSEVKLKSRGNVTLFEYLCFAMFSSRCSEKCGLKLTSVMNIRP